MVTDKFKYRHMKRTHSHTRARLCSAQIFTKWTTTTTAAAALTEKAFAPFDDNDDDNNKHKTLVFSIEMRLRAIYNGDMKMYWSNQVGEDQLPLSLTWYCCLASHSIAFINSFICHLLFSLVRFIVIRFVKIRWTNSCFNQFNWIEFYNGNRIIEKKFECHCHSLDKRKKNGIEKRRKKTTNFQFRWAVHFQSKFQFKAAIFWYFLFCL